MQQSTPSPSQLFFDAWDHDTAHLPQVVAPSAAGGKGPALQAADFAAEVASRLMIRLLGWPEPPAHRLAMLFCLDVVIWASLDGADREALRQRLSHTEAKFLARERLGIPGWAVERGHIASTPGFRVPELPPAFYLQVTERGETKRVLPWPGAERYVTDGWHYGVQMGDGKVRWFGEREDRLLEELHEDFSGVDLLGIVEGLKDLVARETRLPVPLALDVARLEDVLQQA